jgi:hypothetical protein
MLVTSIAEQIKYFLKIIAKFAGVMADDRIDWSGCTFGNKNYMIFAAPTPE